MKDYGYYHNGTPLTKTDSETTAPKLDSMKTKHTPGPWYFGTYVANNDTEMMSILSIYSKSGLHICDKKVLTKLLPEHIANFKLNAAAPDLLEALLELSEQVARDCSISSDPRFYNMLQKHQKAILAIKKATV